MSVSDLACAIQAIYACRDIYIQLECDRWTCCRACIENLRKIQKCGCLKKADIKPSVEHLNGTLHTCQNVRCFEASSPVLETNTNLTDGDLTNSTESSEQLVHNFIIEKVKEEPEAMVVIENVEEEQSYVLNQEASTEKTVSHQDIVNVKVQPTQADADRQSLNRNISKSGTEVESECGKNEPVPTRLIPNVHSGKNTDTLQPPVQETRADLEQVISPHQNLPSVVVPPASIPMLSESVQQQLPVKLVSGNFSSVNQQSFNLPSIFPPAATNATPCVPAVSATSSGANKYNLNHLLTINPKSLPSESKTSASPQNLAQNIPLIVNLVNAQAQSDNAVSHNASQNSTSGSLDPLSCNSNVLSGNVVTGVPTEGSNSAPDLMKSTGTPFLTCQLIPVSYPSHRIIYQAPPATCQGDPFILKHSAGAVHLGTAASNVMKNSLLQQQDIMESQVKVGETSARAPEQTSVQGNVTSETKDGAMDDGRVEVKRKAEEERELAVIKRKCKRKQKEGNQETSSLTEDPGTGNNMDTTAGDVAGSPVYIMGVPTSGHLPDCDSVSSKEKPLLVNVSFERNLPKSDEITSASYKLDSSEPKQAEVIVLDDDDDDNEDDDGDDSMQSINAHVDESDTEEDLDEVHVDTDISTLATEKQTRYAVKLFKDWLAEHGKSEEFENLPANALDDLLRKFYSTVKSREGKDYSRATFVGLRASINRHIRFPPFNRQLSLFHGQEFKRSNAVFKKITHSLYRSRVQSIPEISDEDLIKIRASNVMSRSTPRGLLHRVWFDIMFHFAQQGCENFHDIKPSALSFVKDENCKVYVKLNCAPCTELYWRAKDHPVDNFKIQHFDSHPRMYATHTADCPVETLGLYLSRLNTNNDRLFQRPKSKVTSNDKVWYTNQPVGRRHDLMRIISSEANLSRSYSYRSIRATARRGMSFVS